jgi:ribokinase
MTEAAGGASLVLVIGDVNPDLVLTGDVVPRFGQLEQLVDAAELVIGGSAGITAHGFARLGRPVTLAAAIGTDPFGTVVTDALGEAGVDVGGLDLRLDAPTGLTVVLSTGADRAILTLPGAIPTLTADDVRAAIDRVADSGLRHVHVCSLYLAPALAADLPAVLADVKGAGVTTSLDPNDDPAGAWRGLAALMPHLDVLLPNRREALALARALGGDGAADGDDLDDASRALAERGPLVVVKDGAAGARAVAVGGGAVHEPGLPVAVVDTTGAGDSFNAAFLDGWLRDLPVADCLRRGVLAGASSVGALGGTAAQPTLDQLVDDRRAS